MKRIVQLFVFAACMSVPIIASAEGGLLSPVINITEQTSKTVENVPKAVEAPIKQNSIVEKAVKQTTTTVTVVEKETTNRIEQVEKTVQKTTNQVKSVSKSVVKATETVQTVEHTVEKTANKVVSVGDSKTGIDADLSEKPSIKVDVLDQEASVSSPSSTKKQPTAEVNVPLVSDIDKSKQVHHEDEPASFPAVEVKTGNNSSVTTQKPANIQEKVLFAGNRQKKEMSGEPPKRVASETNNKLPVSKKSYPDYPASKIMLPSQPQGGGQSSSNSSTNSSMANVNTIAFLAIIDGDSNDSILKVSGRFHGKVRHYFDQWLNAPPGQPPQSFFF